MKRCRGEVEILEMLRLYTKFLRDCERQARAGIKKWEKKYKNPAIARWADIPYGESVAYQQARLEFVRYAADIKAALKELIKETKA